MHKYGNFLLKKINSHSKGKKIGRSGRIAQKSWIRIISQIRRVICHVREGFGVEGKFESKHLERVGFEWWVGKG